MSNYPSKMYEVDDLPTLVKEAQDNGFVIDWSPDQRSAKLVGHGVILSARIPDGVNLTLEIVHKPFIVSANEVFKIFETKSGLKPETVPAALKTDGKVSGNTSPGTPGEGNPQGGTANVGNSDPGK